MNQDVLEFVTYCIKQLSLTLNMKQGEVYRRLKSAFLKNRRPYDPEILRNAL